MTSSALNTLSNPVYASAVVAASVLVLFAVALVIFRRDMLSEKTLEKSKSGNRAQSVYADILRENEIKANIFYAYIQVFISVFFLVQWLLSEIGIIAITLNEVSSVIYSVIFSVSAVSSLIAFSINGKSRKIKCLMSAACVIECFLLSVYTVYNFWAVLLFPIIISIRYFDKNYTVKNTALSVTAVILSRPAAVFVGFCSGVYDFSNVKIPKGKMFVFGENLVETLAENGVLDEKTVLYTELNNILFFVVIIVATGVIISFVAKHGRKMIINGAVLADEKNKAELEADEARTKIMLSQLQPHFLYNSLSAIMAIDGNSPETVDALADFSKYLRGNLDSLKVSGLIPFRAELDHIDHYTALEKLRFGEKINIIFDIATMDFNVPPLCVQMAVENAIKHGVTQKPEGGTVTLRTEDLPDEILITVEDDGVGFDTNIDYSQQGSHVGIKSAADRIEKLTGGYSEIESIIGKGTTVKIHLPKEKNSI